MTSARRLHHTYADYLRLERNSPIKHEYCDGEIFAMAGGSPKHSRLKTNVLTELNNRLKGKPCAPFDSDLRVRCRTGLYTYPDASVICGELEFDDEHKDTVLNPTLIVEVLSKTTEAYDRGKQFDHYRTIPALREYVLVSQDEPMVQRFLRNDDDTWTLTAVSGLERSLMLNSIGVELPLAEVFDRVDFTIDESDETPVVSERSPVR